MKSLKDLACELGQPVPKEHGPAVRGGTTDSRLLKPGYVFCALDGEKFCGADFIPQAVKKKAACVIVHEKYRARYKNSGRSTALFFVEDPVRTFGLAARWWKNGFPIRVIGVTGSNGKTTTRRMITQALGSKGPVLQNDRNFNNEIGVPLTLFRIRKKHRILVCEAGINRKGEMERLAHLIEPHVTVVTNIGQAHLEELGSLREIAEEKALLAEKTFERIYIDQENPFPELFRKKGLALITVHPESRAAQRNFRSISPLGLDGYEVNYKGRLFRFPVWGSHNLKNLIMALAVAQDEGVPEKVLIRQMTRFQSLPQRGAQYRSKRMVLIDESYNSNYSSLSSSLEGLAGMTGVLHRVAVIGEMKELGKQADALHGQIGTILSDLPVDRVFLSGGQSREIERKYTGSALLTWHETNTDLARELSNTLNQWDRSTVILVKGSRMNGLEEVVGQMIKEFKLR